MPLEAKVGEVKFYHEMGNVYKVEVLEAREILSGKKAGEEYKLKVLEVINFNDKMFKESIKQSKGSEFSVWTAKGAGANAGWSLSDHE